MDSRAIAGIIANPFAGKDIRRVVAYASTSDTLNKVRTLQRVLVGLAEAGVQELLYMPDPARLVPAAFDSLRAPDRGPLEIRPVLETIRGEAEESALAAEAMVRQGARAIITLGGDGTNRLVARASGSVPLMPLSTGTNNAFPIWMEPMLAGLAAGRVAMGRGSGGCRREKALRITVGSVSDIALVDAAFLAGSYIGAGAIWEPESVRELVVTRGLPHAVGLSAIAGAVCPVDRDEPAGAYLRLGTGPTVRAAIAPGRFAELAVAGHRRIACGLSVELGPGPGVLACDGERLRLVPAGVRPVVQVAADGPVVIDPVAVLRQ